MPFSTRCPRPLQLLAEEDLQQIHSETLRVLNEIGVKFDDENALSLLAEHGCRIDSKERTACIPPDLVDECLLKSPSNFRLRARNPDYDIIFDGSRVHFAACSGMAVLDLPSMGRRPGTLEDAVQAARLCDALENIAGSNTGLGAIADKPTETNLEWLYATAIRNSEKVTSVGVMNDSEKWGIRMAQAAGEDIIVTVNSASPLGWTADQVMGVRRAVEVGLPVGLQSMASPGVTAPATLAGSAVVMNAEILAMAVYVQLLKPGTGMMYSCFTIPLDMHTTALATGSIELGMLTCVAAQLSRLYRMGSIVYLPMTDAKLPDQQAGFEKAMGWMLAAMSGTSLIWGAGMVDGHTLWSNAQLVIDAEMCGMVARCLEGISVESATVAVDLIREIGHFPGNYLDKDHTLNWWKGERYLPIVSLRDTYEQWLNAGSPALLARAEEKARSLLEGHTVAPLPDAVEQEISALIDAAGREKGLS